MINKTNFNLLFILLYIITDDDNDIVTCVSFFGNLLYHNVVQKAC